MTTVPTIVVHGFQFDPKSKGVNNPKGFFEDIQTLIGDTGTVVPFTWYSVPFGIQKRRPISSFLQTTRAWLSSWARFNIHPYRDAWARTEKESLRLSIQIMSSPTPINLIGHSLGTRIILKAIEMTKGINVNRVVLLNGAELSRNAREAIRYLSLDTKLRILNVGSTTDDVLRIMGSKFSGDRNGPCIGNVGLGEFPPEYWKDAILDNTSLKNRASRVRNWTLKGDNPGEWKDHDYTYKYKGNFPLVRAWLAGDDLEDIL
jgi:pimeloyl-ACP methyl ester carboxylesterase